MGIVVEFNPDLALRKMDEHRSGKRKLQECVPEPIIAGGVYGFLKSGLRNYWLEGEIPLVETDGHGHLSDPIASIIILEVTHKIVEGMPNTSGKYRVVQVFGDSTVHFNGFKRI